MFVKASLITLAVLLSARATPVELGKPIAIERRNELTTEDGVFDFEKGVRQVLYDRTKHRQNMINLEKNVGPDAFNEGAKIMPPVSFNDVPVDPLNEPAPEVEKRQSESLTDYERDRYWAGNIDVGTPGQRFLIDFDTGSSDLWFPSSDCKDSNCKNKHKYNAAKSSTSSKKDGSFSIRYADGSQVAGPVYTDTVTVAGVKATGQYFSPTNSISSQFASQAMDGILGLAYPALSNLRQPPFFNTALAQGAVPAGVFSFKLAKSGSELYLGGANGNRYNGDIETHDVVGAGFWQIDGAHISVGGQTARDNFRTIIDSGTTLIYGPPDHVSAFYARIPGARLYDSRSGFYVFPCASTPSDVSLSWSGRDWTISAGNFNLGRVSAKSKECVGAIVGQDLGVGVNTWLVGDAFMKNVYTVFSFDDNTVGFAELK